MTFYRRGALTILWLTVGGSAWAASNTVKPDQPLEPDVVLADRGVGSQPDGSVPFEVDPAMREWVLEEVGRRGSREERLFRLLEALVGDNGRDITYIPGYTGTAQEVFSTGEANCLGFTHLFVGLARELGISVEYLRVHDVQRIERQGAYVVVSGHVSAGYNTGPEYQVLDFSDLPIDDYRHVETIADHSVIALHHVNRGAELMLQGDWQEARPWLEMGVELDPELPEGWVNMGVLLRREGRRDEAEAAYRQAIEIAPHFTASYQNLAAMLLADPDRRQEAMELLDLATRNNTRNPFLFVALGDLAKEHGQMNLAGGYYRRAVSLAPDEAETVAAMGLWALEQDKVRKAWRLMRRAQRLQPDHHRVKTLEIRLTSG